MTDAERDALFARVFATPAGAALIADMAARDFRSLTLAEVEARLARARRRWATGAHNAHGGATP